MTRLSDCSFWTKAITIDNVQNRRFILREVHSKPPILHVINTLVRVITSISDILIFVYDISVQSMKSTLAT